VYTFLLVSVFANYFLFHGMFREQPCQILMEVFTVLNLWLLDLIYSTNISYSVEKVRNENMKELATTEMVTNYINNS